MIDQLVFWSDHARLYGFTVWTLFVAAIIFGFLPAIREKWPAERLGYGIPSWALHSSWFSLSAVLLLFAGRWPGLFYNNAYSVDEAQILAAAQVLTVDPVFFRSAECGSSGPMVVYPLLLSKAFGCLPTLFSSRVIGLAMLAVCTLALRSICDTFCRPTTSRIATLGAVVFFAFTRHWDFVHYTSEHAPLFYLFIGLWCVCKVAFAPVASKGSYVLTICAGAIAISAVPFAKLQAAYLGICAGAFLVLAILSRRDMPMPKRFGFASVAVVFAAALPSLLFAIAVATGSGDYLIKSYFGNALAYVESGFSTDPSYQLIWKLLVQSPDIFAMVAGSLVFAIVAVAALLAPAPASLNRRLMVFVGSAILLLFLAVGGILSPHRDYGHYLLFLPFFFALSAASLAGSLVCRAHHQDPSGRSAYEVGCSAVIAGCLIFPVAALRWESGNPWAGSGRYWAGLVAKPTNPVVLAIREEAAKSNRRMAVWGYMPYYYIDSGLKQATRISTSSALFNDNSLQPFFRKTYLADLKKNRPDVFVDAVAPGSFMMDHPDLQAFERVPEIAHYIHSHYTLQRTVNGVRIFRRNRDEAVLKHD